MSSSRDQTFRKLMTGELLIWESLYDILPSIIGFTAMVNGMATAWPSTALIKFRRHEAEYYLTPKERSWGVSFSYLSQLLAVVPAALIKDKYGNRRPFLTYYMFHFLTWSIIWYVRSQAGFVWAQIVGGMNFGFYVISGPTFLSELTNPIKRGKAASTLAAFFILGCIIETFIGGRTEYRTQAFISGGIVACLYPFLFAVPESPYFLIRSGRVKEAIYNMGRMRGVRLRPDEIAAIMKVSVGQRVGYCDLFIDPTVRFAIMRGLLLTFIQRGSGYSVILVYPAQLLPASFVTSKNVPALLNSCIFVGVCISGGLTDLFGRKSFLIVSSLGTFIFQVVLSWWFYANEYDLYDNRAPQLPLLIFMVHNFMYGIGLFWIPALVTNELLPVRIRAKSLSMLLVFGNCVSFMSVKMFVTVWKTVGVYANFLMYSIATVVGFIYAWFVIETRNKTLDQIQQQLARKLKKEASTEAEVSPNYSDTDETGPRLSKPRLSKRYSKNKA